MAEQNYSSETLLPAEGRSDVAESLEEEQRNAYSAHHSRASSQGKTSPKSSQQQRGRGQDARRALADSQSAGLYPAEGRSDVAESLEEEQRNAYSAHHKRSTPSNRDRGISF